MLMMMALIFMVVLVRTVSCLLRKGSFLSARVNFEILALVELIEKDNEHV